MSLEIFKKRNKENRCAISNKLFESIEEVAIEIYNGEDIKVNKKYRRNHD